MNFLSLQEEIWKNLGYPDTGSARPDGLLQTIKDALNAGQDKIAATCSPALGFLKRESTLSIISGATTLGSSVYADYKLDDYCQRPLAAWTEGTQAHPIIFRRPKNADYDGSRNQNYVVGTLGPYQVTLLPRTTTSQLSGAAGASTGALVVEGTPTVDIGGSNATLTSAVVGQMLRLNGEAEDYKITAQNGTRTITVDRPIKSRMRGLGTTNVGAGYAYATTRWEISPPGRFALRFLPIPTAATTIYYRFMAYPRKLVGDSDTPELQEDMHMLLVQQAMKKLAVGKQNAELYQMWDNEFQTLLADLRKSDDDMAASADLPQVETLDSWRGPAEMQPGEYRRSRFGGY